MGIIGRRITVARIEAGFASAEALAEAIGVSGTTVRNWESGRHAPSHKHLAKLAEVTERPIHYFYDENGGAATDAMTQIERLLAQMQGGPAGEMISIPVYDRATAGAGGIGDEQPSEYRHVPRTWIPAGQENDCYFVTVSGDSMTGAGISEGDMCLVCTAVPVRHGDVAVVRIGEEVVIKRVQELDDALILISENSSHPPRRVDGGQVEIIGRVMWSRRDH